jgi:hypothetical protein
MNALPNVNRRRGFICVRCRTPKEITDLEWQSYRFLGFPQHCGRPMRRAA